MVRDHFGVDGDSGEIVTIELMQRDIDNGSRAGALLDQFGDLLASFTDDGAYDQDKVYKAIAERHPEAAVIVPLQATAILSAVAMIAPTPPGPPPPDYRPARSDELAEVQRLPSSGQGRGIDRSVQARDRHSAAIAHRRDRGD